MNVERDDLSPRDERVQKLVQELSPPPADAAFRDRLKSQFMAGTIPEDVTLPRARRLTRRAWMGVAVPLAAAAALILMIGVLNQGPSWSLVEGEGQALIDGVAVSLADVDAVEGMLHSGAVVEMAADSRACFQQGELVLAELTAGSRVSLPNAPGRWLGKTMEGTVHTGVVRWVTGSAFPGNRLVLGTPESVVEVTGTCFTLLCSDEGTCVCVLEGVVEVTDELAGRDMVPGGRRKTMFRSGSQPEFGEMHERERGALSRLVQLVNEPSGH